MDEENAKQIANILGGEVWDSGGGICLVLKRRSDSRIAALSDEAVCVYADEEELQGGKPQETILLV